MIGLIYIFCEMLTTIKLINVPIATHGCVCVCVLKVLKVYSAKFKHTTK